MMRRFVFCLLLLATAGLVHAAPVVLTLNKNGVDNPDYTNLKTCLQDINAATTATEYVLRFTDTVGVTYVLNLTKPMNMREGVSLSLEPDRANKITIQVQGADWSHIWTVANGTGSFSARDIHFTNLDANSAYITLQANNQVKLTRCTISNKYQYGLMLVAGQGHELTSCTITGCPWYGLTLHDGAGTISNCQFTNNGCAILSRSPNWQDTASRGAWLVKDSEIRQPLASADEPRGISMGGNNLTLENVTIRDCPTAIRSMYYDYYNNGTLRATNCRFECPSGASPDVAGLHIEARDGYHTTYTLRNCLLTVVANQDAVRMVRNDDTQPVNKLGLEGCKILYQGSNPSTRSGLYGGGMAQLAAVNTLIKGFGAGAKLEGLATSYPVQLGLNHCVIAGSTQSALDVANAGNISLTVKNTIIHGDNAAGLVLAGDGAAITKDVQNNIIRPAGGYRGSNDLSADPLFLDPANNDYHIANNSPAANRGVASELLLDIDGQARPTPAGRAPDIGLDEVDETVAVPTAASYWTLY